MLTTTTTATTLDTKPGEKTAAQANISPPGFHLPYEILTQIVHYAPVTTYLPLSHSSTTLRRIVYKTLLKSQISKDEIIPYPFFLHLLHHLGPCCDDSKITFDMTIPHAMAVAQIPEHRILDDWVRLRWIRRTYVFPQRKKGENVPDLMLRWRMGVMSTTLWWLYDVQDAAWAFAFCCFAGEAVPYMSEKCTVCREVWWVLAEILRGAYGLLLLFYAWLLSRAYLKQLRFID